MTTTTTFLAAAIAALASTSACAEGGTGTGPMSSISVMENGTFVLELSEPVAGSPACANAGKRFAFNAMSDVGKVRTAMLMTAYISRLSVEVHGTGDCSAWKEAETLAYVVLRQPAAPTLIINESTDLRRQPRP